MRYMEGVMERCRKDPGKIFLIDAAEDKTLSYGELDELTSKVYAYLSDKGIGKEDFVMIEKHLEQMSNTINSLKLWIKSTSDAIDEKQLNTVRKQMTV